MTREKRKEFLALAAVGALAFASEGFAQQTRSADSSQTVQKGDVARPDIASIKLTLQEFHDTEELSRLADQYWKTFQDSLGGDIGGANQFRGFLFDLKHHYGLSVNEDLLKQLLAGYRQDKRRIDGRVPSDSLRTAEHVLLSRLDEVIKAWGEEWMRYRRWLKSLEPNLKTLEEKGYSRERAVEYILQNDKSFGGSEPREPEVPEPKKAIIDHSSSKQP